MNSLLIIAGGGTGGHLFSGIAVAERWVKEGGRVLFVGTEAGMENELIPKQGFSLLTIPVSKLKGSSFQVRLKTLFGIPRALAASYCILKKGKPAVVLGIGGYASGPTVLAASILGIPTAVIDQNAVPGVTNRWLGKFAKRVFLNFEPARKYFNPEKVRMTGNPVVQSRLNLQARTNPNPTLLVCGGSQGAQALNTIVAEAVVTLRKSFPNLRVIHQAGASDLKRVLELYQKNNTNVEVHPFLHDLEKAYADCDVMVSRSGAGTLTEVVQLGLATILIPYPFAADNHQKANAVALEEKGGAKVFDQSQVNADLLAREVKNLLEAPDKIKAMRVAAKSLSYGNATENVVRELRQLI